jgi:DNA (cytosine-5)-methyltransferase 1
MPTSLSTVHRRVTKIGSLFTGYGGLDMAVPGELAWYSEIEKSACKVLAAHHPDVPNLGDVKAIDWATVPHVDILTGGYPCQPFSNAGMRKGKNDERHLWPYVRNAISTLRPKLAVLENVRGHVSMGLTDVVADLASVGYDARWGVVRASDAGAPHQRARVFIAAYPNSGGHGKQQNTFRMGGMEERSKSEASERQWSRRKLDAGSNTDWAKYTDAVMRWETVTGRCAPFPIIHIDKKDRVNPLFVEWMMGLPEGHVTGHGLSVAQELKMLGNGVVPQQATLALKLLGITA